MPTAKLNIQITESDYLKDELAAETKHEYVDGQIFAMAGASKSHERISGNFYRALSNHLMDSTFEPFSSDIKIRTSSGNYRYPNCMVVCEDDTENEYFTETVMNGGQLIIF